MKKFEYSIMEKCFQLILKSDGPTFPPSANKCDICLIEMHFNKIIADYSKPHCQG